MESPRLAGWPIAIVKESPMGQAALDLPDPLQNHAKIGGPRADDLLAPLAGEEIDRLLAEAEVERPGAQQQALVDPPANTHQPISNAEHEVFANTTTPRSAPVAADP